MAQHKLRMFSALVCFAALIVTPALADSNKDNVNALLVKRQYGAAIKLLQSRANAGDVRAQLKLGSIYRVGLGVPVDQERATMWLGKAAANGNATAAGLLKRMRISVPATQKKAGNAPSQIMATTAGEATAMTWLPARPKDQSGWLSLAAARNLPSVIDSMQHAQNASFKLERDQALLAASFAGSKDAASAMLESGADANAKNDRDRTAVMIAAAAGNAPVVNQLLAATPDLSTVDKMGRTALGAAAANCDAAMFKILADDGAKDNQSKTPALITVLKTCENAADFIPFIHGTMASAKDSAGRTVAWHAALLPDGRILKAVLSAGGDPGAVDAQGNGPLHVAAESGRLDNIRLLMTLAKSSDVQSASGVTPLMLAAESGCADCTKLLIEQTSDIDIKDGAGETALLHAVRAQQIDTIKVLLQKGANEKARSLSGETPGKIAARLGGPIAALFKAQ